MTEPQDNTTPNDGVEARVEEPVATDDTVDTDDGVEELRRRLEALEEQNRRLYARTKRAEASLKSSSSNSGEDSKHDVTLEHSQDAHDADLVNSLEEFESLVDEKVNLRLKGYEPDEVDLIFRYASSVGKRPSEVLGDPFVQGGIEKLREERRAKQAAPQTGTEAAPAESQKRFSEMTREERARYWRSQWERGSSSAV